MIDIDSGSFLAIIVAAMVASAIVVALPARLAPPVVVLELVLGIVIGPQVLGLAQTDEFIEFFAPARRGYGDPTDVEVRVKVRVFDQPRPVEPERAFNHSPTKLWHLREALHDQVTDQFEAEIRGVIELMDGDCADVHVPAGGLAVPKRCVHT